MVTSLKGGERIKRDGDVHYFPLGGNIKGRLVVIAGGGKVALMKVRSLIDAKAKVHVIAPDCLPEIKRLAKAKKIRWIPRVIHEDDLKGAVFAIAATSDKQVNKRVSKWAKFKKMLVNVVDQPVLSNVISVASFKSRDAIVTVFTDGIAPALSRDLKNFIKGNWKKFKTYRKGVKKRKK